MTVSTPETAEVPVSPESPEGRVRHSKQRCGFCVTGHHDRCARTTRNGKVNNADRLHTCSCTEPNCPAQLPRCMDCRNTNADEINIYTMLCDDRDACRFTLEVKRENNPVLQHIRQIRSKTMAETAEKTPRTPAEPKVGKCLVTGKPTKGGNFLPGMDARYVSEIVKDVLAKKVTKAQAEKKIKDDLGDKSANLLAKFQKSLGLAVEREAKAKAAADEKAKAKAESKAQAEKDKAAAKAAKA